MVIDSFAYSAYFNIEKHLKFKHLIFSFAQEYKQINRQYYDNHEYNFKTGQPGLRGISGLHGLPGTKGLPGSPGK